MLDDVGGIDAVLEPSVHPQQAPVALDQCGKGALVAGSGGVQQLLVGSGVGVPGGFHTHYTGTQSDRS
jgi:hypothetical protein